MYINRQLKIYTHTYICLYICMYVHTCICIYIHIHMYTYRDRELEIYTQTWPKIIYICISLSMSMCTWIVKTYLTDPPMRPPPPPPHRLRHRLWGRDTHTVQVRERDPQKRPTSSGTNSKRDLQKKTHIHQKRPARESKRNQKRPTKVTYFIWQILRHDSRTQPWLKLD